MIGLLAGLAAGYLGIGGGLVVVPGLLLIFSRDPATAGHASHLAVATSLASMLATSLSSIVAHHRRHAIRWDIFRRLAVGLTLGALAGALIADRISTSLLAALFGVFALVAGLQLLFFNAREGDIPLPGTAASAAVGSVIGSISSLVGIGGGSMTAPWLMWHGIRSQLAVATAAACGYPIAVAGTVAFMSLGGAGETETIAGSLGYVHLPALLGIAVFSVMTAPIGAWLVHKSPPKQVRRAFGVLLLVVAARILMTTGSTLPA